VLEWIEATSVGVWMRESPSVWAFPTILTLHTVGLGILVGASWVLDLRLLGVSRNTPLSAFRWAFPAMAVGLTINLVTGAFLFIKNATTWGTAVPFLVKMLLVVVSVVLLLPIRKYVARTDGGQLEVSGSARLLAVVSILAWTGAVTAGRLLAYLVV
jgi:hypothetical protein